MAVYPDFMSARAAVLDPTTPPGDLATIAQDYPSLQAMIVDHPAVYDGLLDWIETYGEPQATQAVAAKRMGGATPTVTIASSPTVDTSVSGNPVGMTGPILSTTTRDPSPAPTIIAGILFLLVGASFLITGCFYFFGGPDLQLGISLPFGWWWGPAPWPLIIGTTCLIACGVVSFLTPRLKPSAVALVLTLCLGVPTVIALVFSINGLHRWLDSWSLVAVMAIPRLLAIASLASFALVVTGPHVRQRRIRRRVLFSLTGLTLVISLLPLGMICEYWPGESPRCSIEWANYQIPAPYLSLLPDILVLAALILVAHSVDPDKYAARHARRQAQLSQVAGYPSSVAGSPSSLPDARSGGYATLGFFFPIVGLILYIVWKDQTPLRAKSAGKGALISVIVWAALSLLSTIAYIIIIVVLSGSL